MSGKTTPERLHYGPNEASLKYGSYNHRLPSVSERSDLGETRVVVVKEPSWLKHRLGLVAVALRQSPRNPDLIAQRDALFLEAHADGWSVEEIRRAVRGVRGSVDQRLRLLLSNTSAPSSGTTG